MHRGVERRLSFPIRPRYYQPSFLAEGQNSERGAPVSTSGYTGNQWRHKTVK
jgi:hypothetical protein